MSSTAMIDAEELRGARVYAGAAWKVAAQEGRQAEFLDEFRSLIRDVLDRNPAVEQVLRHGGLTETHRSGLIDRVFKGRASDMLYNFLRTLVKRDRLGLLRTIGVSLEEIWKEEQGKKAVLIRSAVPLDSQQIESLRRVLADKLKIDPEIETETDPSLLGGLWVRVGDIVYDRTVRTNLRHLHQNILARSTHEVSS